ncbi:MAG: hypothetical protein BGO78_05615 [Chloroflexi bacterium 44-23]|nr:MAG: hypothetical protein BGO78_05615 [Chloroflexi bacterium 44-23]
MSTIILSCVACGTKFSPTEFSSCNRCPLHSGCAKDDPSSAKMVCCPNCGTEAVNPYASSWARWLSKFLKEKTV